MGSDALRQAGGVSADLTSELADIPADALVADIRASRNLAETRNRGSPTGSSPSGYVRTKAPTTERPTSHPPGSTAR